MILIYPPVAKPAEPPAGLARLSGVLGRHGVAHRVIDANIEGALWLMNHGQPAMDDTWTRRAHRNIKRNLASIRGGKAFDNFDRYCRAVLDLNRALQASACAACPDVTLGLTNYQHARLAPTKSADLIEASRCFESDPYYPYFSRRIEDAVQHDNPSIIGLSVNYLSQALPAFGMAGFIKKRFPSIRLIMGGGLVSSWMSRGCGRGWINPFEGLIDHMIAGPGEGPLLEMLGITERAHSCPDYSGLPLGEYLSPGAIIPYSGSSGCWWNKCAFCPERAEGNVYVQVAARQAASDIRHLAETPNTSLIHLLDNAISPALFDALIAEPPGVPWYGFARISNTLASDDFCMALKRSGCVMLKLGLESGDQGVLDKMQKGIDLETASRALRALRRAGISAYVYLLFGTPAEAEAEAIRTLEFTRDHAEAIGFLNIAVFNMPLYGPEAERYETGGIYEGDLSLYSDFEHPLGWSRQRVRDFIERRVKRDPIIAEILRRTPPLMTSNHAAYFAHYF